ncbi:MAG: M1 family metallopeptidase [Pseudomonadota bacterium]
MTHRLFISAIALAAIAGCSGGDSTTSNETAPASHEEMSADKEGAEREAVFDAPTEPPVDKFTYANYHEVKVTHAEFDLAANFDTRVLSGAALIDFEYLASDAESVVLDTNGLAISSVEAWNDGDWEALEFSLGADDPQLGSPLKIMLDGQPDRIRIEYSTSPDAGGLQWLEPAQTAGKEHPFMFSQFQPILARSFAPLQDTPAVRMTYTAKIKTPPELIAVMGAAQDPDSVRDGDYFFEMPQPIPSYLIAIAIGDIEFKAINDHMGVYAEEYILEASAAEFADTPQMEEAIDALYGPYLWGRYDMIVLPPSFPFGGMENPRLSFLTPTLVAGDKSLTNVVAHELAHSWSGNLVTNSTWRDAWLNEGFTSYVENRVMEELYGERRAVMERSLDMESLKRDIAEAARPELTALKMPADIDHPDDAFSQVSYAGGMFFLTLLEERFGRDAFDEFLRGYFETFAFDSITTEDFLAYFEDNLWAADPDAITKAEINAWVYEPGLPATAPAPKSDAFEIVSRIQKDWLDGDISAAEISTGAWSTHEWLHFLNGLPGDLTAAQFAELDTAFSLSGAQNAEIANAWYLKTIAGGYEAAKPALREFLLRVGRGKFIYRLYQTLVDNNDSEWAAEVYEQARSGYHPIAQTRIDAIFDAAGVDFGGGDAAVKTLDQAREEALAGIDIEACEAAGGVVRPEGLLGLPRCVKPYSDAGTTCVDGSDCEGRCLSADGVTDYEARPGEARGLCEADDSPFGCFAEINRGTVGAALCVD